MISEGDGSAAMHFDGEKGGMKRLEVIYICGRMEGRLTMRERERERERERH